MPRRSQLRRISALACSTALTLAVLTPIGGAVAADRSADPSTVILAGDVASAGPAHRVNVREAGAGPHRAPQGIARTLDLDPGNGSDLDPQARADTDVAAAPPAAVVSSPPELASVGFAGMDWESLPCGGATPCWVPAASGVAVGPYDVVQATSTGIRMSDRDGLGAFDVSYRDFFPSAQLSGAANGRVAWDAAHGRWIVTATGWRCDDGGERGFLIVGASASTDPQWYWTYWLIPTGYYLPIQPTLGTSSNKIVVGYGLRLIEGWGPSCFSYDLGSEGARMAVVDWTDVVAGASLDYFTSPWNEDPDWYIWRPALVDPTAPTGTAYAISRSWDGERRHLWLARISGTVSSGVSLSIKDLTAVAPEITQQWGPMTDLVRRDDELFTVADDRCEQGDVGGAPCVRVSAFSTSGSAWLQDFTVGQEAKAVTDGAIEVAADGTLHVTFSVRPEDPQTEMDASTWTVHQSPGDPAGTVSEPALVARGRYLPSGDFLGGASRLAPDPLDPHAVWQADAYGGDPDGGWTTWISRLRTGVPATPSGTISIEADRPTTHALRIHVSAPAASGTQLLLSSSSAKAGGKLVHARQVEPSGDIVWDLSDESTGGSTATGNRRVYVQWGDGAGAWSAVQSEVIRYVGPPAVIRLAGADRYATAAAIARSGYAPGVDRVFVATGANFPDALAGAGAAGHLGAPVLLVAPTSIPAATASALTYLEPARIVVLGGTGVVSNAVRTALATYVPGGAASVTRLAGADRFATAAAISAATYDPGVNEVLLATGMNFPDALAGTAVAARDGAPLLLVTATSLPSSTATELARLTPHRIVILGGPGVVGDSLFSALRKYTDGGLFRVFGANRYETAASVAAVWFGREPAVGFVATGANFPDALAGGALAGRLASPLLLVPGTSIPPATDQVLEYLRPAEFDVLGGPSAVSPGVEAALTDYLAR